MTAAALVPVHLVALPVPVTAKAQQHDDELLRELALMQSGESDEQVIGQLEGGAPTPWPESVHRIG